MILLFVTSGEKWAFSDSFFCSEGDADRFSDAQFDLAQETSPLCLEAGFISSIIPSLNRGSGSGVSSGWTNAFILDVFSGTAACWNITSSTVIQLHNALNYALIICVSRRIAA